MSFTIRYKKTGKEITLSNKALFLHLTSKWLDELGFEGKDLWENEE